MKKRIYFSITVLTSIAVVVVSVVLCMLFYNQFTSQVRSDLQVRAQMLASYDLDYVANMLRDVNDIRVTLIEPDGTVTFDNTVNYANMENHLHREEVREALSSGNGESSRYSNTIKSRTYYYAVRLADGSVMRLAKTINSIWKMFAGVLPAVIAIVLFTVMLGYFVAGRLAEKVVDPIKKVDFDREPDVPYDELAPFVKTIVEHRHQIAEGNEKLQARTDTINAIMDNMNEGVVLLDRRGHVLSVNKSAAHIFATQESMEGRSALELLRDIDFADNIQKALIGYRSEMSFQKAEKEYRVLISPVAETGVVVLLLDITEKIEAERMRKEFSANVSHELKTPLTSIYGNAEMLQAGVVKDSDKPVFYGKIMNEAARLIALIEDIIMLSELDEGKVQEYLEKVNLVEVASECAEALEQKAAERQVKVNIAGFGEMTANRFLIYEMFYNLFDNAIKYNKMGGNVEVVIAQTDKEFKVTVADNGIGIPAKEQQRIFERFYRVEKSRSKKSGGTGLGLAIVKHVVLTYGGEINVVSEPNKGTEFQIVFSN